MTTPKSMPSSPGRSQWQSDLFPTTQPGPMRALWRSRSLQEIESHSRNLLPESSLVMCGQVENDGPCGTEMQVYFWFRRSPCLSTCALCVEEYPLATARHTQAPAPTLLYLFPTSNNVTTLVRWLVSDYAAETGNLPLTVEKHGNFDLTGIVDGWPENVLFQRRFA